jgi:sterol desaturase/sphingolipid hydroxylase (fatty acid hydroxylase superfamily)
MLDQWIVNNADDLQVILFFTLFGLFTVVELAAPRRTREIRRRSRWVANLILTALNIVVLSLLPVTFFTAAVWAQGRGFGLLNLVALPLGVSILSTLLGRAFVSFFTHWLMHRVPLLWRLHRVHHLDTEMDVSTTVRFHPVEFAINLAVGVPFVCVFGTSPWVLLLYEILDAGVTLFSHANFSLPPALERVLRYVIVTPDLHRVHHSSLQPETDSNYGAVFPIWDILLGTFRTDTSLPHEEMELGLEEVRDRRTDNILWLLASPIKARLELFRPPTEHRHRIRKD